MTKLFKPMLIATLLAAGVARFRRRADKNPMPMMGKGRHGPGPARSHGRPPPAGAARSIETASQARSRLENLHRIDEAGRTGDAARRRLAKPRHNAWNACWT